MQDLKQHWKIMLVVQMGRKGHKSAKNDREITVLALIKVTHSRNTANSLSRVLSVQSMYSQTGLSNWTLKLYSQTVLSNCTL